MIRKLYCTKTLTQIQDSILCTSVFFCDIILKEDFQLVLFAQIFVSFVTLRQKILFITIILYILTSVKKNGDFYEKR